jgi:hypothetical protein
MTRAERILSSIVENTPDLANIDPEQAKKIMLSLIATGALTTKAVIGAMRRRRERGGGSYPGESGYYAGDPTVGLYKKEGLKSVKSRSNTGKTRRNKRR